MEYDAELRQIKKETGITIRQMADLIGRTERTMWNYLHGKKVPKVTEMEIIRAFSVERQAAPQ